MLLRRLIVVLQCLLWVFSCDATYVTTGYKISKILLMEEIFIVCAVMSTECASWKPLIKLNRLSFLMLPWLQIHR